MPHRTSVTPKDKQIIALLSRNECAFPKCKEPIVIEDEATGKHVITGEVAHIIANRQRGPRGEIKIEDRDDPSNLIYLCHPHHRVVDDQPNAYSSEVLLQMKRDHESRFISKVDTSVLSPSVSEEVQSSLLRIVQMPSILYVAGCAFTEKDREKVRERIDYAGMEGYVVDFTLHDRKLFTFNDLTRARNPFSNVISAPTVRQLEVMDALNNPDTARIYKQLLNSALRKTITRFGLRWDKNHSRFYFQPAEGGSKRVIRYQSLGNKSIKRNAAYQPIRRSTGEPRPYWIHLAAQMTFEQLSESDWGFNILPSFNLTLDGFLPITPKLVARRVNRMMAKRYNGGVLSDLNFWKEFLMNHKPRLVIGFGTQKIAIDQEFITSTIIWPSVEDDTKQIKIKPVLEDLFTQAEFERELEDSVE